MVDMRFPGSEDSTMKDQFLTFNCFDSCWRQADE